MPSKLRKNHTLKQVSQNLHDAQFVARFLGISLNALYLRMHFDNFPKAVKINGKLYFGMTDILEYFRDDDEKEAFAFLVRDEIRSLIDTGRLSRKQIGELLDAKNPSVSGGAVYARAIGYERAQNLKDKLGVKLEIDESVSFVKQKKERADYILAFWGDILTLFDDGKLKNINIGELVCQKNCGFVTRSVLSMGPSYKVAKLLRLKLLQKGVL
jgi:predicted DNA-binding transcriptional regulator AlpA